MEVLDVEKPPDSAPQTIMGHEKERRPGAWGEPKYCERCRDVLPPHYTLRFCERCRKETIDEFLKGRKAPEW